MNKKLDQQLDRDISNAFKKYGNRVQIRIMDTPQFFEECKEAVMQHASTVDDAVIAAIAKYRQN